MPDNARPPNRGIQLYENIFKNRAKSDVFELISDGINSIIDNASALLNDAEILFDNSKFSSAGFLVVTADEEMAKVYMLLDVCKLDFDRQESVLRKLCRCFYDHVKKYAYNRIVRLPSIIAMDRVKSLWDVSVIRWFPAGYESGEPDMPHETVFLRERNLYVDYNDYDQKWDTPDSDFFRIYFEGFASLSPGLLDNSREALNALEKTCDRGFFGPQCLSIINDVYKDHYINENTDLEDIGELVVKVLERCNTELGLDLSDCKDLAINALPLYHFV